LRGAESVVKVSGFVLLPTLEVVDVGPQTLLPIAHSVLVSHIAAGRSFTRPFFISLYVVTCMRMKILQCLFLLLVYPYDFS